MNGASMATIIDVQKFDTYDILLYRASKKVYDPKHIDRQGPRTNIHSGDFIMRTHERQDN